MNFLTTDWRDRRNILNQGVPLSPMQFTIANYSTEANMTKKTDVKSFEQDIFSKIHSIPDPLKKNLADTVITANKQKDFDNSEPQTPIIEHQQFYFEPTMPPEPENSHRRDYYPTISGITSYISNFFGAISGAVFQRRPKSPATQYYDCFECDSHIDRQMAEDGKSWLDANLAEQNKKRSQEQVSSANGNMNNCRTAVSQCEDKINAVRNLLKNKTAPTTIPAVSRLRRRPKRAFVEPGAVTDTFEEEFTDDNYVSVANDEYIEYFVRPSNQNHQYSCVESPKMKVGVGAELTDIVKVIPNLDDKAKVIINPSIENCNRIPQKPPEILPPEILTTEPTIPKSTNIEAPSITINNTTEIVEDKKEIISSCEDKMAKLKAMLLEKKTKKRSSTDSTPEPVIEDPPPSKPIKLSPIEKKQQDKHFKNPHRHTDKRLKLKMRKNIKDDMMFANEIDSEEISSADNSPAPRSTMQQIPETLPIDIKSSDDFFDELKGRFQSASVESDDSFQIVFTDSPKHNRARRPSDCDSEDSFIVFEGSPDCCYTSTDIFGDQESEESEVSDSESDMSDSGCGSCLSKVSQFSRTVSDLTDDSLYEDSKSGFHDEVDCAVRVFEEIPVTELTDVTSKVSTGLLLDEAKKLKRKGLPPKTVTFSSDPPIVRVMRVWAFASRQARIARWEEVARDRDRFRRRIADVDMAVSWVLRPQHRSRVMFQRIMPWRNQQKRIEAAEKKKKEAEQKIKKAQEDVIEEDFNKEMAVLSMYDDIVFDTYRSMKEISLKHLQNGCVIDKVKKIPMKLQNGAIKNHTQVLA